MIRTDDLVVRPPAEGRSSSFPLQPGKVVVCLAGRMAGKKAVIVKNFDDGQSGRSYGHALVVGLSKAPGKVRSTRPPLLGWVRWEIPQQAGESGDLLAGDGRNGRLDATEAPGIAGQHFLPIPWGLAPGMGPVGTCAPCWRAMFFVSIVRCA